MTWRYQLTRQEVAGEVEYAIREVFLDEDGGVSWTRDPIRIVGDSPEEVNEMLIRIRTDIKRGGAMDIPAEGDTNPTNREIRRQSNG